MTKRLKEAREAAKGRNLHGLDYLAVMWDLGGIARLISATGVAGGPEHVEALIRLRNGPMSRVMAKRRQHVALHGMMQQIVLEALKDGPKTLGSIVEYVAERRPEISYEVAYGRTAPTLTRLKATGLVERNGGLWRLARSRCARLFSYCDRTSADRSPNRQ